MTRPALTDRDWTRLEPLLPKRRTGRASKDHRIILDALLWFGKTGAPWRDLLVFEPNSTPNVTEASANETLMPVSEVVSACTLKGLQADLR